MRQTSDDEQLIQPECPHCGGTTDDSIVQLDSIEAIVHLNGFYRDEKGELTPEYSGQTDYLDETAKEAEDGWPYLCRSCMLPLAIEGDVFIGEPEMLQKLKEKANG